MRTAPYGPCWNGPAAGPHAELVRRGGQRGPLLDRDGGAGALESGPGLVGGVLGDLLQDRLRRVVDQVLGLLEAERGQAAHLLDDLDLLVAGALEDDVELVLLGGGLLATATAATGGGSGRDGDRGSGGDLEGLLELLHEVGQLEQRHLLERVEQVRGGHLGHGSLLLGQSVPAAVSAAAGSVSGVGSAAAGGAASAVSPEGAASSAGAASAGFFSCSAAASRATCASGAWNRPAALVRLPFSAPASLASRTSRGSTSARRVISRASTVRPSTTPPLTTSSGWARAKSRIALAALTGSPSMKAIAVGPLSSGVRSPKPTSSAARFVRVFLTTAYLLPSPRERRSWVSWATVSPRYSVSTAALDFWNRSVISSITAALACVGMGLLSSVGRPPEATRQRAIPARKTTNAPAQGARGEGRGTRRPPIEPSSCAGRPGAPGPSITRGRATTSGLGGNVDKGTAFRRAGGGRPPSPGDVGALARFRHRRRAAPPVSPV